MGIIEKYSESLRKLCKLHQVDKMYLFGSAVTTQFNEQSDVDILVKFKPIALEGYFDNYMNFKEKLENLFGRKVDLLEEQALRNPILIKSINNSKELIYGW